MSAPIKVLALTPIPEEGAGCRFRVSQYVPYLRNAGFDVTISPFYTPEFFRLVYQRGHYARKYSRFEAWAGRAKFLRAADLLSKQQLPFNDILPSLQHSPGLLHSRSRADLWPLTK